MPSKTPKTQAMTSNSLFGEFEDQQANIRK